MGSVNYKLDFTIPKAVVSDNHDMVVLDFDEFITPLVWPFPQHAFLLKLITFLYIKKTKSGYQITCQVRACAPDYTLHPCFAADVQAHLNTRRTTSCGRRVRSATYLDCHGSTMTSTGTLSGGPSPQQWTSITKRIACWAAKDPGYKTSP